MFIVRCGEVRLNQILECQHVWLQNSKLLCVLGCFSSCDWSAADLWVWVDHAHTGYGGSSSPCKAEVFASAIHRAGHWAAALTIVWGCRIKTDFPYKSMTVQWRTETNTEVKRVGAIPRLELRAQFCHVFAERKKSLQALSLMQCPC